MNVLFVTHVNNMGGANRSMLQLILELEALGVSTEVILPKTKVLPNDYLGNELKKHNIPYITDYYFFYRVNCLNGLIRYFSNALWYTRILFKLRGKKFNIVHSNSSFTDLGFWVSKFKRIPHIWHLREYGNWGNSRPALGNWFDRVFAGLTSMGIAVSKKQASFFRPIFKKDNLRVIYNGVEKRNNIINKEQNKSLHTYNFCMVGNLCEGKNQIMAVEGMRKLISENILPMEPHLTLIGSGNIYESFLKKKLKEYDIEKYVSFTGEINDVDSVLEKMNCGLILTNNEAFGRVTIEYMLHSLPVIGTDSGANPEIIQNGKTGCIISQDNIDQLANVMKDMINYSEKYIEMGKRGQILAITEYSAKKNAYNIYKLYKEIIFKK